MAVPPGRGDFNGDGATESVSVIKPNLDDCEDPFSEMSSFNTIIQFSDPSLKSIIQASSIDCGIENLGDLNGDGKDELGVDPVWLTSAWRYYHVYSWRNGTWIEAVPQISTHSNQREAGVPPVSKPRHHNGTVVIHYSEMCDDSEIRIKSKTVPIQ